MMDYKWHEIALCVFVVKINRKERKGNETLVLPNSPPSRLSPTLPPGGRQPT